MVDLLVVLYLVFPLDLKEKKIQTFNLNIFFVSFLVENMWW